VVATGAERATRDTARSAVPPEFDELYRTMWWPMLRLATGLVDDVASAEDVVQDAFAALYRKWHAMREPAAAAGYLRISVVNAARSALRRRATVRRHLRVVDEGDEPAADHATMLAAEHDTVRAALAGLPARQREVLTLRYLADLSDDEIAAATGISTTGVRSAASRGLAALRTDLGGRL
jgi:RNA polymerase sigma-70 factor (sigma-E family)